MSSQVAECESEYRPPSAPSAAPEASSAAGARSEAISVSRACRLVGQRHEHPVGNPIGRVADALFGGLGDVGRLVPQQMRADDAGALHDGGAERAQVREQVVGAVRQR